jgi:hypothetical protein
MNRINQGRNRKRIVATKKMKGDDSPSALRSTLASSHPRTTDNNQSAEANDPSEEKSEIFHSTHPFFTTSNHHRNSFWNHDTILARLFYIGCASFLHLHRVCESVQR